MARELATARPLDLERPEAAAGGAADPGLEHDLARKALRFAMKISPEVYALHVAADEAEAVEVREQWR